MRSHFMKSIHLLCDNKIARARYVVTVEFKNKVSQLGTKACVIFGHKVAMFDQPIDFYDWKRGRLSSEPKEQNSRNNPNQSIYQKLRCETFSLD